MKGGCGTRKANVRVETGKARVFHYCTGDESTRNPYICPVLMTITSGARLGPYEIVESIGAGGMGEVWRAKDTRLDREVAIKVLPTGFAKNEQFLQRFEREARAISSLNHPHICTLFDVGVEEGAHYLVMELIEGESLADRLKKGPLSLHDVLRYGRQIASALDAAHRQGVIHRDLKPGNVMLTKSGAKLLDFGLAKSASEGAGVVDGLTSLPTEAKPLTQEGTILGTFQYMAPEQLEGLEADARTDIFALGAVLYEMATGKRAFAGETKTSLIAAIVSQQPAPISQVTPMTPPALDHVVRRCLEKDPDDRWQSAHDIASELQWISEAGSQAGVAAPVTMRRKTRERLAWSLLTMTLLALVVLLLVQGWTGASMEVAPTTPVTFTIEAPEDGYLRSTGERAAPAVVSPDGSRIVYGLLEPSGRNRLWMRGLDSTERIPLPGTEGGSRPFWSPDGRSIGFFARGKLMRLDLAGGVALPLADAEEDRGGTWMPDGHIIFEPMSTSPLMRVAASGGTPEPVTELDREAGEASHRYPSVLADGRTVVFLVLGLSGQVTVGAEADQSIEAVRTDSGERKLLLRGGANAQQVGNELLFYQGGALRAQPIDLENLELTGSARTIVEDVKYDAGYERASFSASHRTLIYERGPYRGESVLTWVAADGTVVGTVGEEALQRGSSLSPDGRKIAVTRVGVESPGLWVSNVDGGQSRRISTSPNVLGTAWSPDGARLAYSAIEGDRWTTLIATLGGGTTERILGDSESSWLPTDWSPDGKYLILARNLSEGGMVYDLETGGDPEPVLDGVLEQGRGGIFAELSPNGRWLAYQALRDGVWDVEITSFPRGRGRWSVSQGGGIEPRWSPVGDALFYRTPGGGLVRTSIDTEGADLRIGQSERLFQAPPIADVLDPAYDVAPGGERFLFVGMTESEAKIPLTVTVGWREEPRRD